MKLIAGGRTLQDDSKPCSGYNIGPTTRVLVTKGAAAQHSILGQEAAQQSEEARLAQLERLKATVEKLASRGDGRGLTDKYEFSLENQVGLGRVSRGHVSSQQGHGLACRQRQLTTWSVSE